MPTPQLTPEQQEVIRQIIIRCFNFQTLIDYSTARRGNRCSMNPDDLIRVAQGCIRLPNRWDPRRLELARLTDPKRLPADLWADLHTHGVFPLLVP